MAAVSSISSQILEVYHGVSVPVIGGAFVLAVISFLLVGEQASFLYTPFAVPWVLLLVWWGLAALFGMYPSGSLEVLIPYSYRIHILPLLFTSIAKTTRHVRQLLYCFAAGYALVLVYCFRYGRMSGDRFVIPDTSFGNANDLALHLLLGGCFMLIFLRRHFATRLLWFVSTPVLGYYILKTGSRGSMLTLLAALTTAIFITPARVRLRIVAGIIMGAVLVVPLLPSGTIERLLTFTSIRQDSYDQLDRSIHAVGSTQARTQLQKRAIELTLRNPVFGVGPTMFPNAVDELVRATENRKSSWQVSHNTYLEVSSESGIPGLIFYTWTIFLCLKLNLRVYFDSRSGNRGDIALQSMCLFLVTVTYAFGVLFSSIAYDYHLAALVGFTAANHRAWGTISSRPSTA